MVVGPGGQRIITGCWKIRQVLDTNSPANGPTLKQNSWPSDLVLFVAPRATCALRSLPPGCPSAAGNRIMRTLVCFIALCVGVVSAQQPVWQAGVRYEYTVDSRSWRAPADDDTPVPLPPTLVERFNPPVGPQNFGFRCHIHLSPVQREQWPSSSVNSGAPSHHVAPERHGEPSEGPNPSRDGTTDPSASAMESNAWLVRGELHSCTQTRSRFHGPFIVVAGGSDANHADPVVKHAGTPFYFVHSDDGRLRELYFFGNETLRSRNFKRGMVSFLNLVRPESIAKGNGDVFRRLHPESVLKYQAVDHDEQGVYVLRVAGRRCVRVHINPCLACDVAGGVAGSRPSTKRAS